MKPNIVLTKFLSMYTNIDFFKDVINVCLYPSEFSVSIGGNDVESVPKYLNSFFLDLKKLLNQYNHDKKNIGEKLIDTAKTILTLRSAGKGLITYETVGQHFSSTNAVVKKLIQTAIDEKIDGDDLFRTKINNIVSNIDYFYDLQKALGGMTEIHEFLEKLDTPEVSVIEAVEKYKEMSLQLNNDLSQLSTVSRDETATDYYILSDDKSTNQIAESITKYIYENYSFYCCGLDAYDESVDGFESSSVHLVASPSNGGKSITLANLFYKLAQHNKEEFVENDAALYISCEDDLIKTTRKFISIFGNYGFNIVRNTYKVAHEYFSEYRKNKIIPSKESHDIIVNLYKDILTSSIVNTTKGTLKIIFKYSPENSLSAGDIQKQIEKFKHQGINIKYIIIDYLDVLRPTLSIGNGSGFDDYNNLGVITQELRTLSRIYGIPVISATQTNKEGDKVNVGLSNSIMGESWKKVKYSDFVYMQRIRDDLDLFHPEVAKDVFLEDSFYIPESPQILDIADDLKRYLKPLEMRVTKSKEKGKGYHKYMLFCTKNLRIYNFVDEYFEDMKTFDINNKKIIKRVENVIQLSNVNTQLVHEEPLIVQNISNTTDNPMNEMWNSDPF